MICVESFVILPRSVCALPPLAAEAASPTIDPVSPEINEKPWSKVEPKAPKLSKVEPKTKPKQTKMKLHVTSNQSLSPWVFFLWES